MDSLATYASSDEDASPKPTCKRKASPPAPSPQKKRKLPSLPPSLTPPAPASNPALHQGRTRTQPHVEGQFASYVYVQVALEGALGRLVKDVVERASDTVPSLHTSVSKEEGEEEVLHVSLSRPVYLRHHQREAFKSAVKAVASTHTPFSASFATFATFINDEHTRAFLALEVGAGHSDLHKLADGLGPALRRLYQKEYYEEPRFHASLAWALVRAPDSSNASFGSNVPTPTPSITELPQDMPQSLHGTFGERLRRCGAFEVREVRVRIGKEVRAYALAGGR